MTATHNAKKPLSPRKQLLQLTGILSQPLSLRDHGCKPDMRTTRVRSLKSVCNTLHITRGFERRSSKYGSWREFTTDAFAQALTLPDKEFNKLITTLATLKKFNQ